MGLKIFSKLVVYITYNMGNRDLPDVYAHALGPAALGLGHIYQANPSCPCYNYYIYRSLENFRLDLFRCKIFSCK